MYRKSPLGYKTSQKQTASTKNYVSLKNVVNIGFAFICLKLTSNPQLEKLTP